MKKKEVALEAGWKAHLEEEFEKPYMNHLREFLKAEANKGKVIYPAGKDIFAAFNSTPFDKVKAVIIGQDPYHGPDQAHGLCFSVKKGVATPPSLVNIYKELQSDVGLTPPTHGFLQKWADEGVLLLNNVLTVEKSKAGSHHNQGWETFTDKVIEVLNQEKKNLVFILWGSPAQKKAATVDPKKHCILKSPHPSPLSAYRGFFGSQPFSKTNAYLKSHHLAPINWELV